MHSSRARATPTAAARAGSTTVALSKNHAPRPNKARPAPPARRPQSNAAPQPPAATSGLARAGAATAQAATQSPSGLTSHHANKHGNNLPAIRFEAYD